MVTRGYRKRLAAAVLLVLICTMPWGASGQGTSIPAASLKNFTAVEQWQVDVTWSVRDSYEDASYSAHLEATATARFILKQDTHTDARAVWRVRGAQSAHATYTGFVVQKGTEHRTDHKLSSPVPVIAWAEFQVGGRTPGYELTATAAFPAKRTDTISGTSDSQVSVMTGNPYEHGAAVLCMGPLPASGETIHGSREVPYALPPFGEGHIRRTKLSIEYVIQPLATPAPPKQK